MIDLPTVLTAEIIHKIRVDAEDKHGPEVGLALTNALDESQRHTAVEQAVIANTAVVAQLIPLIKGSMGALDKLATAEESRAKTEEDRQAMWSNVLGKNGIMAAVVAGAVALGGAWLTSSPPSFGAAPPGVYQVEAAALPPKVYTLQEPEPSK